MYFNRQAFDTESVICTGILTPPTPEGELLNVKQEISKNNEHKI